MYIWIYPKAAEDLEKSDKEQDEDDEEDSEDENGWMVPDGHLSDDELGSQKSGL